MLNTTLNASENARLPNTKNLLISVLTLIKTLNVIQNVVAEHGHSLFYEIIHLKDFRGTTTRNAFIIITVPVSLRRILRSLHSAVNRILQ